MATLLAKNRIIIGADIALLDFIKAPDSAKMKVKQYHQDEIKEMSLTFSLNPLELQKIDVLNAENQTISITFLNKKFNHQLSDELFTNRLSSFGLPE